MGQYLDMVRPRKVTGGDVLQDAAAISLLCRLEDAGVDVRFGGGGVVLASGATLAAADRQQIDAHHASLAMLVLICDAEVQRRREAFVVQLAKADAAPGPLVPALRYRTDVAATPGVCVSCGDRTAAPTWCWRCQLAARLALRLPVPADWEPAGGFPAGLEVAA